MSQTPSLLHIHPDDNVAVALRDLGDGEDVQSGETAVRVAGAVPRGHKLALRDIASGEPIIKYGHPIGKASAAIPAGAHVHSHNLKTALGGEERYAYQPLPAPETTHRDDTFQGYRRPWGKTGTRNEIWVLNTVGCVNRTAENVARSGNALIAERGLANIDGVHAFAHPFGCSQLGDDLGQTRDVLRALALHPNAGGVIVIGLGCENNRLAALLEDIPPERRERIISFNAQDVTDEEEEGEKALETLLERMSGDARETCPASQLALGMKCGGSDAFSGLSANPLVGRMTDRVTASGGTAFLTEVPEMFGAERLLMNRAKDEATFRRIVDMVEAFKTYFTDHGQPVYENPSPGNKDGGLTTLEEKSLGAVQKGGGAAVTGVLGYAEPARETGLNLINAPGNDAVSSTALSAAGANILLFTTGRGTPLGFPVPTLKVSSNTPLAERKPRWIDFNAGALIDGTKDMDALADDLWAKILATASGEKARNEENDYREIAIWKTGVTL